MTETEIITLGEYCEDLMQQESFNAVARLFEQQITHDFLATNPEEKAKREGIYASYRGVTEFMALMNTLVQEKNAIINRDNELPEDMGALPQEID